MKRIPGSKVSDPMYVPDPQFNIETVFQQTSKECPNKQEGDLTDSGFDQNPMYERTMSTLRQFSDCKLKMAMRQVEIEKKLSKALDEKIHHNLEFLATHEKKLKKQQSALQEKLDKATHELLVSEKFSAIGELTSKFTHDVRNPLTVIQSQLEILQMKLLRDNDNDSKDAFLRIFHALSNINHMIEQVLNFVRAKPLDTKVTDLSDILELSVMSMDIPDNVELILPKESQTIVCDDYQIGIVLNNLILNSLESFDNGGRIQVKILEGSDHVTIQVEDSGPGIPEEIRDKIFEPLFTTKQKGTGLGLASCFRIVLQHHGTIKVQNNPTRFSVILPKNPPKISNNIVN